MQAEFMSDRGMRVGGLGSLVFARRRHAILKSKSPAERTQSTVIHV